MWRKGGRKGGEREGGREGRVMERGEGEREGGEGESERGRERGSYWKTIACSTNILAAMASLFSGWKNSEVF